MVAKAITIIKASGVHEDFDAEKLRFSLLHAGASPEATEEVIKHVTAELKSGMTTQDIYEHAFTILSGIN